MKYKYYITWYWNLNVTRQNVTHLFLCKWQPIYARCSLGLAKQIIQQLGRGLLSFCFLFNWKCKKMCLDLRPSINKHVIYKTSIPQTHKIYNTNKKPLAPSMRIEFVTNVIKFIPSVFLGNYKLNNSRTANHNVNYLFYNTWLSN